MHLSQFYSALEEVYGSTYGRSLLVDLYLPQIGSNCADALEKGIPPHTVWCALINETDYDPELMWAHRMDSRQVRRVLTARG